MVNFEQRSKGYIEDINNYLVSKLPDEKTPPTNLHQAMHYSVMNGGKRVRPSLSLLCAEAVGSRRELALPAAIAVEFIHCYEHALA